MSQSVIRLNSDEEERLREGILAGFSVPLIDDVEDFVFEAILCHMKGIPLASIRNKRLFDIVAPDGRGWSAKTLKVSRNQLKVGGKFELVIQRADVFAKAAQLGFPRGLSARSSEADLGRAVITHWNRKYDGDLAFQKVKDPRVAILLKDEARRNFAYVEMPYPRANPADYTWQWSRQDGKGLKGFKNHDEYYKWYHGQKQLFEVFRVPKGASFLSVEWRRQTISELYKRLIHLDIDGFETLVKALEEIAESDGKQNVREIAQNALASRQ